MTSPHPLDLVDLVKQDGPTAVADHVTPPRSPFDGTVYAQALRLLNRSGMPRSIDHTCPPGSEPQA